ncbi:MAG: hypothetical protein WBE86_05975 [Candidatus Acidiferrales bacterium]
MPNVKSVSVKVGREIAGVCLSLVLGVAGGALCGAAILVFGGLIGRSGNTGEEYIGDWNVATVWLGMLYGAFFGAIVGPIAYVALVRKMGFQRALLPAFLGTLAGGFLGALVAPPMAALSGIGGFLVGVCWAKDRRF